MSHYNIQHVEKAPGASANHPKPISTNVGKHIDISKKIPCTNDVVMHTGKFSITLTRSNRRTRFDGSAVMQKIQWIFEGTNVGNAPMKAFSMVMSLSVFTPWEGECAVKLKAFLKKAGIKGRVSIQETDIIITEVPNGPDTRMVTFNFPQNITYKHAERFKLEICMTWRIACYFQDVEYYFTDPQKNCEDIAQLEIEVKTNMEEIMGREYRLYTVDRESKEFFPVQQRPQIDERAKTVVWKINDPLKALYAIEIRNSKN